MLIQGKPGYLMPVWLGFYVAFLLAMLSATCWWVGLGLGYCWVLTRVMAISSGHQRICISAEIDLADAGVGQLRLPGGTWTAVWVTGYTLVGQSFIILKLLSMHKREGSILILEQGCLSRDQCNTVKRYCMNGYVFITPFSWVHQMKG